MGKSPLKITFLIGAVALGALGTWLYEPSDRPATKTASSPTSEPYPGLVLIPKAGTEEVILVDRDQSVVHQWNFDAERAWLLPNCNLLVLHGSKWGRKQAEWQDLTRSIREYDWEGKLVWEHVADSVVHHDAIRTSSGETVFLQRELVPSQLKKRIRDRVLAHSRISSDRVVAVNRAGEITWSWAIFESLSPSDCGRYRCREVPELFGEHSRSFDWTHTNSVRELSDNSLYRAGDKRFRPGSLLLSVRNHATVYLLDRPSGRIVWKYSGGAGDPLSGVHDAEMIPEGLPGAGNILLFDNGRPPEREWSRVVEVDPSSREVVWSYQDDGFHSRASGSAQRLPNGNTLISEDLRGHVFEVTRAGEIVWRFKSSVRTCRARKYSFDHCPQLKHFAPNSKA